MIQSSVGGTDDRRPSSAETIRLGAIRDLSQIQLHADPALNAIVDAGLRPADIDGIATTSETPVTVAHYLGLTPKWSTAPRSAAARS
jgi:3-oxoacyl-[acyl-carrier-protein] synthase III